MAPQVLNKGSEKFSVRINDEQAVPVQNQQGSWLGPFLKDEPQLITIYSNDLIYSSFWYRMPSHVCKGCLVLNGYKLPEVLEYNFKCGCERNEK